MATRRIKTTKSISKLRNAARRADDLSRQQRNNAIWWYDKSSAYNDARMDDMAEYTASRGNEMTYSSVKSSDRANRMVRGAARLNRKSEERTSRVSKASGGKG